MLSMLPIKGKAGFLSSSRIPAVEETVYVSEEDFGIYYDAYYVGKVVCRSKDGEGNITIHVLFESGDTNSFRVIVKG